MSENNFQKVVRIDFKIFYWNVYDTTYNERGNVLVKMYMIIISLKRGIFNA